ncbi:MAG TPA: PilT/PilU family type 4a pilus ATPase [Candidatus Gracilibacteria bacterium]
MVDIEAIVSDAIAAKASDIHISPHLPVYFRVNGKMRRAGDPVLADEVDRLVSSILNSTQLETLKDKRQLDFMFQTAGHIRLRGNAFKTHLGTALCFRLVQKKLRPYSSLGFPDFMKDKFLKLKQGLILIVGPTGQGKSTTLASVLTERNKNLSDHIVTIEDPIEYVLESENSIIQQREIGRDVMSFPDGIRSAMREDPNVVVVGEIRDAETMVSTITLAETGHLVFGTLHTNSVEHTIARILDSIPSELVPQVKSQLAQNLQMIIAQRLVPTSDGKDRVLAYEIMNMNIAVGNLIREDKVHQIQNTIQTDQSGEMIQFEQSLASLMINKFISEETAFEYAPDHKQLEAILEFNGLSSQKD